jgi:diacylglycerol kinase
MRKTLVILLTFIGGLYYFAEFFLAEETTVFGRHMAEWNVDVGAVVLVISIFAVFLGAFNLLRAHLNRIINLRPGWHNSVATVVATFAMFGAILMRYIEDTAGVADGWGKWLEDFLFFGLRVPLDATVFSLLAFYIANAAYRAFRVRSVEAMLMMGVAFFVMVGQMPWVAGLTQELRADPVWSWADLSNIKEWIKDIWNSAGQRGILLGVMVGQLAMSLRIWLSLERGSFFDDEL